jgi:membrane-bound lytic murein transglycosylase D
MLKKIVTLVFTVLVCVSSVSAFPFFNNSRPDKKPLKEVLFGWMKKKPKTTVDMPTVTPVAEKVESTSEPESAPAYPTTPQWVAAEWDYSPETLDSLLTALHSNNTVTAFEEYFDEMIRLDTTEVLTSTTPDSVYQARLRTILSPIGLPWNPIVKRFVVSYTTSRRSTMSLVLSRSQYYFPIIEEELMRAGLPLELRMLPVVESGLRPTARSRMGAMGLWQFMYSTGKNYGLEQTTYVDQRCDPVASTRAACRFLADLYKMYGDWTLALAAYNCGPGNVNKALKKADAGAKNFWDIYPYLPSETRDYVPSFIAATYAYTFHRQHDIPIAQNVIPLAVDTVTVSRLLHLNQVVTTIDVPLETLQMLNPQYRQNIVPALEKAYPLVLPQNQIARFIDNETAIHGKDTLYLAEYLKPANIDQTKAILTATATTHRVKSGENLGSIARKYGVTVKQIIRWNNLKNPNNLKVGQRLEINGGNVKTTPTVTTATHVVKSGENLRLIAEKYGVTSKQIISWNKLKNPDKLKVGQRLEIKK